MFLRAILAFLALPGVVAIFVPLLWLQLNMRTTLLYPAGLILLCFGFLILLWCVRDFYVAGKGTLAPWSPPVHLVVVGLYRHSRNPMYIAVTLILLGWAISFSCHGLLVYAACVAVGFYFRVILVEEPRLALTFGPAWTQYKNKVRRWF